MQSFKSPPSWALRILHGICPQDLIEEVEGDLYEAFQWRSSEKGVSYAKRHYVYEVIRCLRYLKFNIPFKQNSSIMLINNYLKTGFRFLWKTKGYSSLNIIGLATGIAVCWLAYVFVSDEYSYDRFQTNADNLYRITASVSFEDQTDNFAGSSYLMGEEFNNRIPGIKASSRFKSGLGLITIGTESFNQAIRYADPEFFEMFDIDFVQGSQGDFTNPLNSVISESTAERLGITDLDETSEFEIQLGSQVTFQVTGIFKDYPTNSSIRPSIIVPFNFWKTLVPERRLTTWFDINMNTFLLLDGDPESVQERMTEILRENADFGEAQVTMGLQALTQIHMDQDLGTGNGIGASADGQLVTTVTVIGLLCLLIACMNYSNFAIGNYLSRIREVAVRKIFGAQKKLVFQQFVVETFISAFLALILAIAIMALILPTFSEYANKSYTLETIFGIRFLWGGLILLVLVTFLAGVYPAFVISRYAIVSSLRGRESKGGKAFFAKALVVVQFTMAVFLITGMITVNKQLNYLINFDIGYEYDNVISILYGEQDQNRIDKFKNDLLKIPAIQQVAISSPYNGTNLDMDENTSIDVSHVRVDPDYLSMYNIPILNGRDFDKNISSDFSDAIIINKTLADMLGMDDPVGQRIPFDYGDLDNPMIIGVVSDYHYSSLHSPVEPLVMYMSPEYIMVFHNMKVNSFSPEVVNQIEDVWNANFAPQPFDFSLLEDNIADQYELEASIKKLSQSGAAIAIVLSCLGLMGVVGTQVRRRLKEVSIRKVVGAAPSQILALFSLRYVGLVILGFVFGLIITVFFLNKWLADYTNRIDFTWDIGAVSVLVVLVISALTIASQLYRAMFMNPVTYLKED